MMYVSLSSYNLQPQEESKSSNVEISLCSEQLHMGNVLLVGVVFQIDFTSRASILTNLTQSICNSHIKTDSNLQPQEESKSSNVEIPLCSEQLHVGKVLLIWVMLEVHFTGRASILINLTHSICNTHFKTNAYVCVVCLTHQYISHYLNIFRKWKTDFIVYYTGQIHTCDKFQKGIREIFLSFQGGLSIRAVVEQCSSPESHFAKKN